MMVTLIYTGLKLCKVFFGTPSAYDLGWNSLTQWLKVAELFWVFGGNEETNKKIRKHQSFKKYWNEENH